MPGGLRESCSALHLAKGAELLVAYEPAVDARAAEDMEARLQDGLLLGVQDVSEAWREGEEERKLNGWGNRAAWCSK